MAATIYQKRFIQRRKEQGLYLNCGEPLDRDGRICKKCSEIMTKNLPKERNNKAWREDNKLVFANKY